MSAFDFWEDLIRRLRKATQKLSVPLSKMRTWIILSVLALGGMNRDFSMCTRRR